LLLQFQGMIAEYERAQILERSRRGKRHRALQGVVNVLCGAPYGYRYIRKTEHAPASYAIIDVEATVVRKVYEYYTVAGLSIGAITRLLNEQGVPTRKRISRWERSVVWAMLRNPAYMGTACFNKTKTAKRQRITRPIRLRGGFASRDSAHHERPREEWIEIAVPPIVTEETFALAAERLQANKDHAPRRTITPSVVQVLVSCRKCSYGLYRTSTRTSARMIYYYRCLGSDAWRRLGGPICDSKPIRQDLLDEVVWREILKLLESPHLIQEELERRLAAARSASPVKQREENLQREFARVRKSMERLMTAYQEDLMSVMPSDWSVGNAFGPLRDFFCKFAIASHFVQCVWHGSPRSHPALLRNIEHFTHQSLYKRAHPERFFKIICPASSALPQFVSWPGPRPPRPDSDLTHAAPPLQVSCRPDSDGTVGGNHRRLIGYQRTCRWNGIPVLSVEQQRDGCPPAIPLAARSSFASLPAQGGKGGRV
jgi:Recombinase/Recombinase zinc beta ribbon domain